MVVHVILVKSIFEACHCSIKQFTTENLERIEMFLPKMFLHIFQTRHSKFR